MNRPADPDESIGSSPRLLVVVTVTVALVGLVAMSVAARWDVLSESAFSLGVDGYYYPIQLRSLLETGSLHYPTAPVALWLMAPFAWLTDPIVGAKLAAAVGGALIALPAYAVGRRLGRSRIAGLVAAALATPSAGSAFLSIEFVKQSIGLTLAVTAIALALRALERRTRTSIVLALVGYAAAVGAHKLAAGVATIIIAPAVLAPLSRRRRTSVIGGLVVGALVVGAVVVIASPRGVLGLTDLRLLGDLVTSTPRIEAPALVTGDIDITFGHEALVGAVIGLVAIVVLIGSRRRAGGVASERAAAWAVALLAIGIGLPWLDPGDPQGLTFRLRASAFVLLALGGSVVAGAMLPWLADGLRGPLARLVASRARARRVDHPMSGLVRRVCSILLLPLAWFVRDLHRIIDAPDPPASDPALHEAATLVGRVIVVALAIALALRTPGDRRDGEIVAHPTLVSAALAVADHVPAGDVVIVPERHIAFMVAWYTGREISLRPEPIERSRRWRMIPRRFFDDTNRLDAPLDQAFDAARREPGLRGPIDLHARMHDGIVVMPEATWEWVVAHLPPSEQRRLAGWPTR